MPFVRTLVNALEIQAGVMAEVAQRSQFSGEILIEATGIPYSSPRQWGVAKLVNSQIPPDMIETIVYQKILYDRCTALDVDTPVAIAWDKLFVYCTEQGRRFTDALTIWDITFVP